MLLSYLSSIDDKRVLREIIKFRSEIIILKKNNTYIRIEIEINSILIPNNKRVI